MLPFLGVLVYLIAQHDGMRERTAKQTEAQGQAFDQYVRRPPWRLGVPKSPRPSAKNHVVAIVLTVIVLIPLLAYAW